MIKIIDNNSPRNRDYNTKQSSVKNEDRPDNFNKLNGSNIKASNNKKGGYTTKNGSNLF